jgi:hypothetical protein
MRSRPSILLPFAFAAALLLGAADALRAEEKTAGTPADAAQRFVGTWRVKGVTTDLRSGDTREIAGIIVLDQKGAGYTGSSELETKYPAEGGAMDAHVIGTAEGALEGETLTGKAKNQLVMGMVPGLEAEFAFAPRMVGPRLESNFKARFRQDGTLLVEIDNRGAQGEAYSPTRTVLYGTKIEESAAQR